MNRQPQDIKSSALHSFRRYIETEEERHLEEFLDLTSAACERRDVQVALEIWEEVIPISPDRAEAYLNAARFCEHWTWKLRDGHFDSKGVNYMRGEEWFFGKRTPWLRCMDLAMKAIRILSEVHRVEPGVEPRYSQWHSRKNGKAWLGRLGTWVGGVCLLRQLSQPDNSALRWPRFVLISYAFPQHPRAAIPVLLVPWLEPFRVS